MVSTIQISNSTKNILSNFREIPKQTYEEIILNLIRLVEIQRRKKEKLIIEGCKEMTEENLKICEEFKYVDAENLPEWEGGL